MLMLHRSRIFYKGDFPESDGIWCPLGPPKTQTQKIISPGKSRPLLQCKEFVFVIGT